MILLQLDLERIVAPVTPLIADPRDHLVVSGFLTHRN